MNRWFLPIFGIALLAGCATSGPVELLDDDADAACMRAVSCLEKAFEAQKQGRFDEARPFLVEACRRGDVEGCRHLGNLYAMGALGAPERERAAKLYRWGCEQEEDGSSCHSLGELYRSGFDGEADGEEAQRYFGRACELGEPAGCHDEAVGWVVGDEVDEEQEEAAVAVFDELCEAGWSVGCVNLAYMQASGRGTAREHRSAQQLFAQECRRGQEGWSRHPLGSALDTREEEPDVYAVTEFSPEVACDQLEVLVVGGFEERIIAAFEAEKNELESCYAESMGDEKTAGRLEIEAGVASDGDGIAPRIIDDQLGLAAVNTCVEEMLSRHLQDRSETDDEAYRVQWVISFLHPPPHQAEEEVAPQAPSGGCDTAAIQEAVGSAFPDIQECGRRHIQGQGGDPGAVVARFRFDSSGGAQNVMLSSTVDDTELQQCLETTIVGLGIPPFDSGVCEIQVPFSFSDGERLHFSVIAGR